MKKSLLLIFLVGIFFNASNQEATRINLAEYRKHAKQPDLTEIASDIKFVKLETKESCLVGNIDRILLCGKNLLILANSKKSLFLFSDEGRFICQIGSVGKGPRQYVEIYGLAIDPLNQNIYLLDNGQNKRFFAINCG